MATYPAEDIRRSLRAATQVEPNDTTQVAGGAATGVLRNVPPSGAEMRSLDASRAVQRNRPQPPNGYRPIVAVSDALRGSTALGAGGVALAAAPEALRTGRVLDNRNATWNDVGTQLAEGAGRIGAAGAGAAAGATLGAGVAPFLGPFAPVAPVAGGLAGAAYGYFAGDKAIRGLRNAFGLDARSPDERLGVAPAGAAVAGMPPSATPVPATPTDSGLPNALNQPGGPTGVLPRPSAASDYGMGAQPGAAPAQSNQIIRRGNSYEGTDVRAGFTYGGDGNPNPMGGLVKGQPGTWNADGSYSPGTLRGGGTVSSLDTREGFRQDQLELQRNAAARAEAAAGGGTNLAASGIGSRTALEQQLKNMETSASSITLSRGEKAAMRGEIAQLRNRLYPDEADASRNATQLAIAQMNNATQRRSNDQTTAVALRGHQLDYERALVPIQQAEQQRQRISAYMNATGNDLAKAQALAMKYGDPTAAKLFADQQAAQQSLTQAQDTQAQTRSKTALDVFAPFFSTTKDDGKGNVTRSFDEVGAKEALAVARNIFGAQFESMTPDQQRQLAPMIMAKVRNQQAERQVVPGWIDSAKKLVGMYEEPPEVTAPRDLRGAQLSRAGMFDKGVPNNNFMVTLPNGQVIDYGKLTADQLKDLEQRGLRAQRP
jgi:hypothetical protein